MQAQTLTCVIVDDEVMNTDILTDYVSQIPYLDLKVVFQDPIEALAFLLKNPTDLLIVDIVMPQLTGIQLYECIATQVDTQVIFISGYAEKIYEVLQKYTVVDCLAKPISFKRFEEAVEIFMKLSQFNTDKFGEISKDVSDKALENFDKLSKTEIKVLQLIAQGKTTKEVADIKSVSEGTVEVHRNSIRKKLKLLASHKLSILAQYLVEKLNIKVSDEKNIG
jgi:DNA-binding NarL/FixJ family response regulator